MKKIISIALVVLILGSITVFAMGFNQRDNVIQEYEGGIGYGPGHMFTNQEFSGYRQGHMFNNQEFVGYGPGHMFNDEEFLGYGPGVHMYSEEFIEEFEIDEEKLYEYMKERHEERIDYFVEEGILTEEEAEEALKYFEENYNSESGQFVPRSGSFGPGSCFQR